MTLGTVEKDLAVELGGQPVDTAQVVLGRRMMALCSARWIPNRVCADVTPGQPGDARVRLAR